MSEDKKRQRLLLLNAKEDLGINKRIKMMVKKSLKENSFFYIPKKHFIIITFLLFFIILLTILAFRSRNIEVELIYPDGEKISINLSLSFYDSSKELKIPYYKKKIVYQRVDIILLNNNHEILLIQRKNNPYKDKWELPGEFVKYNETLEKSAKRRLEKIGIKLNKLYPFKYFDKIDRDPRGRTITFVFWNILHKNTKGKADSDAKDLKWFKLNNLPKLAFDHQDIVNKTLTYIKSLNNIIKHNFLLPNGEL